MSVLDDRIQRILNRFDTVTAEIKRLRAEVVELRVYKANSDLRRILAYVDAETTKRKEGGAL